MSLSDLFIWVRQMSRWKVGKWDIMDVVFFLIHAGQWQTKSRMPLVTKKLLLPHSDRKKDIAQQWSSRRRRRGKKQMKKAISPLVILKLPVSCKLMSQKKKSFIWSPTVLLTFPHWCCSRRQYKSAFIPYKLFGC